MSPDFHRHGLFHPRRSAVSQLAKAPSAMGRIRKEALQPAHRIRTGRPSALPKPHHCCGRFYCFFAALFSKPCRLFFRYPYLSRGERTGWDRVGDRMGTGWGCGISLYPNAERTPCFSATPSIGTQNATAVSEQPPRHRSTALLSPCARPAQRIKPLQPPSAAHAHRAHHFFCSVQEPKMNAERPRMLPICNISASFPAICNYVRVRRTLRVLMFARASRINRTGSPRLRSLRPASRRFHRRKPARPFPQERSRRSSASG